MAHQVRDTSTNVNNIFVSRSRLGRIVFFVAQSWEEARRRASEEAGKKFRYVCLVTPGTAQHREAERELGLVQARDG